MGYMIDHFVEWFVCDRLSYEGGNYMFRKWNRFLAFLLSIALVITTFGSDFASAKVYAEGEAVEDAGGSDDAQPETEIEDDTNEDEGGGEYIAPEDGDNEDDVDEDGDDEDADDEDGEGEDADESDEEADPEAEAEEKADDADGEKRLVTVTYVAGKGGEVSKETETIDLNDEEAKFEGATATPWNAQYTFENWTKDGEFVSDEATFVPADLEEDATFTANFKEAENTAEEMPAINESASTGGMNVSVSAPTGLFPKGTTVSISAIGDDQALATAQEAIPEATAAKGVDITFYDADGNEVQPANNKYVTVSMSLDEALEGDGFAVVHDHGEVETIGANISTDGDGNATSATFASGEFSVFIIANSGTPSEEDTEDVKATLTYKFFIEGEEEPFNEQTVKENEILYNPGIPALDPDLHQEFDGWYTKNGDAYDKKIVFGQVGEITSQDEIKAYAKIQSTYYLTFIGQEGEIVQVKRIEVTGTQTPYATVDDIEVKPNKTQQAFFGWAYSEEYAQSKNVITNNSVNVSQHDHVYASVIDAFWIHFNENDGGTGGGASFTGPISIAKTETPSGKMPKNPTRPGYVFAGWYYDAACTSAFDENAYLEDDITLYAKWNEGTNTKYTVIIWKQKVTDKKNATQKTYDYETSVKLDGVTNSKITDDRISSYTSRNYTGFKYSKRYEVINGSGTDKKGISASGNTIVNVYYDRNLLTIQYKNYGSVINTMTGLYGQTLTENGYSYNWKENVSWYYTGRSSNTYIPVLDTFKFDNYASGTENSDTLLVLHQNNATTGYTLRYIKQNIDKTYPEDSPYTNTSNVSNFSITEKFDGFKAVQYRLGKKSGNTISWSGWKNGGVNTSVNLGSYTHIDIRYERLAFNITFMDGTTPVAAKSKFTGILYETPLASYKADAPAGPEKDGLKFVGWYEDMDGQTPFNWNSTMPAANKVLYAYYTNVKYEVKLYPNGGTIDTSKQKDDFYVNYGATISKSSLTENISRDGYVLIGWYDMDKDLPYDFDAIRGPATDEMEDGTPLGHVNLIAKWRDPGLVHITYDANGGTNPPKDTYGYAEDSSVVVGAVPKAPEGKAFIGWQITADGKEPSKLFYPNNSFSLEDYADYIVNRNLTLTAFYEIIGGNGTSTEEVVINYDPNGGTGTTVSKTYRKNQNVLALTLEDTGFSRKGFNFLGWDKDKDAETPKITAGQTIIGADNVDDGLKPFNTLYAIWEEATGYYVVEYYRGAAPGSTTGDELLAETEAVELEDGAVVTADDIDVDAYRDMAGVGYKSGELDPESITIEAGETKIIKVTYKPVTATITVKGKYYAKEYTGKEQTVEFPTNDDLGFEVVSIEYDADDVSGIIKDSEVSTVETIGTAGTDVGEYEFGLTPEDFTCSNTNIKIVEFKIAEDGILEITPVGKITVLITGNKDEKPYNGDIQKVNGFTFEVVPEGKNFTADDFTYKGEAGEAAQEAAAVAEGENVGPYDMGLDAKDFAVLESRAKAFPDVEFKVVSDGKLTITPLTVTITVKGTKTDSENPKVFTGKKQTETGFDITYEVDPAEGVEDPDSLFDIADVIFDKDGDGTPETKDDAVAEGITPGEYKMGLEEKMFSLDIEFENFIPTFVVEDGLLIIIDNPNPFTVVLTAEGIETPYNGYTQKYVIRPGVGVVDSANPVQATIQKIADAIANFFTIKADAADEDLTFDFEGETYTVKNIEVTAEGRNAGTYDFTVNSDVEIYLDEIEVTKNFKIDDSGLKEKLTITTIPLTLRADNKSKAINTTDPELTAQLIGLVGEDAAMKADIEEFLKKMEAYTIARDPGEAVGNYPIRITLTDYYEVEPMDRGGQAQRVVMDMENIEKFDFLGSYDLAKEDGVFNIYTSGGPTPPPDNPPGDPGTPSTPAAPPAGAVLGATREVEGPQAAVLGARRGRTEDTANSTARIIAVIVAAAVAATVLLTKKKKEEEEEA